MIGPRLTGPTARLLGVGLELGVVIGGLTAVGYFADGKFGTMPYLTMAGALIGTSVGCYNAYRAVNQADRARKAGRQPPIPDPKDREQP